MRPSPIPEAEVEQAERKVNAILEELEESTDTDVKDIDLEDVVDTDLASGKPTVRQAVDITVQPRSKRSWLK